MALMVASGMRGVLLQIGPYWRRFLTMQQVRRERRDRRRGEGSGAAATFGHKGADPKWESRVRFPHGGWLEGNIGQIPRNSVSDTGGARCAYRRARCAQDRTAQDRMMKS